jgi:hypothetical protein
VIRELVDNARRSGDRIGVDGAADKATLLGADAVRLARLATSIHLAETVRRSVAGIEADDPTPTMREILR